MSVTILDPIELLRQGLATWWAAQSTLTSLGTVELARDDGSPASGATATPHVIARIADAVEDITTNSNRHWMVDVTFELFHTSPEDANLSAKPLDRLLAQMNDSAASIPSLPEGTLVELRWTRSRMTQLSAMRWRADRECMARIVVSRTPD